MRTIQARDLEDLVAAKEIEAAARRRTTGIHDAEVRKRRQLALELAAALREPLVPGSAPHDLDAIAALIPRVGRAR